MTADIWGPYRESAIQKPHAEDKSIGIAKTLNPISPNEAIGGVSASSATRHDGTNEDGY